MIDNSKHHGILKVNDYQLRYSIEGSGVPTLIIGSQIYYPRTFSENLRKHLKLIFIDHRGFGISPKRKMQDAEFELEVIIDDIEQIRKALGLERMIVAGHSGHAFMALEYAKKYPEYVSHVVMLGITPSLSGKNNEAIHQFWQQFASSKRKAVLEKNEKALSDEKLKHLPLDQQFIQQYIRSTPKIWYDYHYNAAKLWEGVEINMQMFNYVWGKLFRDIDITKGLNNFSKPIFLGLGKYDFIAPYNLWDPILPQFQNITIHVFEKSGHTPQLEESEIFDDMLLAWIKNASKVDQY